MELTGNQKLKAPRPQVFKALLEPTVLKNCIPGCESAEYVDTAWGTHELKAVISLNLPGLKGAYTAYIRVTDAREPEHVVLITEPHSALGSVKAACTIDLADDPAGGTDLS